MKGFIVAAFLLFSIVNLRADGPCGDGCGGCGWDPDAAPAHFMITGTKNAPGYTFFLIDSKSNDTIPVKDSVAYAARGGHYWQLIAFSSDRKERFWLTTIDKRDDVFVLKIVGEKVRSNGTKYIDYDQVYTSRKDLRKAAKAGFIDEDRLPPPLVFLLFSVVALGFFVQLWRQRKKAA